MEITATESTKETEKEYVARVVSIVPSDDFMLKTSAPIKQAIMMAADLCAIVFCTTLGYFLAGWVRGLYNQPAFQTQDFSSTVGAILFLPIIAVIFISFWRSHYYHYRTFWTETREIAESILLMGGVFFFAIFLMNVHISRLWVVLSWGPLLFTVPMVRVIVKKVFIKLNIWHRPLIIMGTEPMLNESALSLTKDYHLGYRVAAKISLVEGKRKKIKGSASIHSRKDPAHVVAELLGRYRNPHLLLVFNSPEDFARHKELINRLSFQTEHLIIMPPLSDLPFIGTKLVGVPKQNEFFIHFQSGLLRSGSRTLKRIFDLVLSALLFLMLSPLMLFITLFLLVDGGSPFYGHRRIGRMGKEFTCWKFRTMIPNAKSLLEVLLETDEEARKEWDIAYKLKDDPRVTNIGDFLRKTSLDELPQIWNVLKGEMSLVGPRPIVTEEIERYGKFMDYYVNCSPGITGLWQISGRNDIEYSERVNLDVWYVRNWSLWSDIVILISTIPALLTKKGAY